MTLRVPVNHPDRAATLDHFITGSRAVVSDVGADVAQIIATFCKEGDSAVIFYTEQFADFAASDMAKLAVPSSQL